MFRQSGTITEYPDPFIEGFGHWGHFIAVTAPLWIPLYIVYKYIRTGQLYPFK